MPIVANLRRSNLKGKKWKVTLIHPKGSKMVNGKRITVWEKIATVQFGQAGASDYTRHKDAERKKRYLARHGGTASGNSSSRENWSKSGYKTAGFWSRWLLWNKPTIAGSSADIKKRFGIIVRKR